MLYGNADLHNISNIIEWFLNSSSTLNLTLLFDSSPVSQFFQQLLSSVVESDTRTLQEFWNSNLELNLFVFLCLAVLIELVVLIFLWKKHSPIIIAGKSLSQSIELEVSKVAGAEADETDTVKKSFSNTLLHPNRHYKAD